jgi:glucose-1-phosphate thymidylyltransferase
VERMIAGGATKLCFVISPGKSDIVNYYGGAIGGASIAYVVQPEAGGLCDAVFRAAPLIADNEHVLIGLPDTIWFPVEGLASLPDGELSFLLFPVERPEFFDAVVADDAGRISEIRVKRKDAGSNWIWGALKMPGRVFHDLHRLWLEPERGDEYIGTLVNAYLARGGTAVGVRAGRAYVDVGTLNGYREAIRLLAEPQVGAPVPERAAAVGVPGRAVAGRVRHGATRVPETAKEGQSR